MAGCGRRRAALRARRARRPAGDRSRSGRSPGARQGETGARSTNAPNFQPWLACSVARIPLAQSAKLSDSERRARRAPVHLDTELWVPETVADILAAHRAGRTTPEETVARSYARIRAHADPAIFIALREEAQAQAEAREIGRAAG